jgi:hypothetical protein
MKFPFIFGFEPKIFDRIIIIAGCGGGYDLFCGVPLYRELSQKYYSKQIVLINYSFTETETIKSQFGSMKMNDKCYAIDCETELKDSKNTYFPEYHLAKHLDHRVYALTEFPTCNEIIKSYQDILNSVIDYNKFHIDENTEIDIYLVDGGSDSIMKGNEKHLGTPVEDIMHMKAVNDLKFNSFKINKYLCLLGANVDTGHSILFGDMMNRLNHLEESCLVSKKILDQISPEVQFYIDAFEKSNPGSSIVNSLVIAAIKGHRGYYLPDHLKHRISENVVELSELTCTFYVFTLTDVIKENLYYETIDNNMDSDQVDCLIGKINGYVVV